MALNQDLIAQVLCRVPVKPLLRCRCVSKDWCSLIDTNVFVKKHIQTAFGGGLIINVQGRECYVVDSESVDVGNDEVVAVPIKDPLMSYIYGAEFFGAANGLVCVAKDEMNDLLLLNPFTKKAREILVVPAAICGFGYDRVNDDYKVVKIADCKDKFFVFVYNLKTNSWKRILNVPSYTSFLMKWGVFACGALYWLTTKNQGNGLETIVSFDFGLEQFEEVPFPAVNEESVNLNRRTMVPLGESLCIFDSYPNHSIDVWLMNKNGSENSWCKAFTVNQPSLLGSEFLRPLAFSKSQTVLLLQVGNRKLMWYDLRKKTFKNVSIRGIPMNFYAYLYNENLLPLDEDEPLKNRKALYIEIEQ